MVATPTLTLTITPPGGSPTDYTQHLAWAGANGQLTLNQNFGRQGDTATLTLVDEYTTAPTFYVPVLSQVKLVDTTSGQNAVLFAGVVTDPVLNVTSPTRNEWTLACTDYTFYADNALVHGNFYGQTVDQIVVALTQQAGCGITAASVASGGFVAPGPQLASFILNYSKLSDAWRKLAQLAGQATPFGWYVDENRNLHFYDATTAQNSGVTFTTSPTTSGSLTEGHYDGASQSSYEWDGTSIRNRILVQGATQTVHYGTVAANKPTDTWLATGAQTSWPLRYTVTGSPVLHVAGVSQPVTVVQAGDTSTPVSGWSVVQNVSGQWFLTAATPPGNGVLLQIWYDYQIPVVAQANDYPSQAAYTGPNSGVFQEYINDSSLTTVPMALARALRERTEYAFAAERITFSTTEDWLGWVRAGQTCRIVNQFVPDSANGYQWGLDDTFIVVSNSVTFGDGGYRQSSITAVRI